MTALSPLSWHQLDVPPLTTDQIEGARKHVCGAAVDADDARELLDMLGIGAEE
jgi:hypothetical protein